jgi:hypothetical protein
VSWWFRLGPRIIVIAHAITGKGLAEHLQVPLPYLLYRAQTRYEEDLRRLVEIREALSPTTATQPARPLEEFPSVERRATVGKGSARMAAGGTPRLSSSARLNTPLAVRARLSSFGNNSARSKKASSSSTLTLQGATKPYIPTMRPTSASSEEDTDSEDEAAAREEEADRKLEEQEALDRKLKALQKNMTSEALGLVSSREKAIVDRGRIGMVSTKPALARPVQGESSSRSTSQSVSGASSPQGSIPSIPSPPPGSQPHSPISRHLSPSKSSSPPAVSPRSAHGQSHLRYGPLVDRTGEQDSSQGSETSSFSDLSGESLRGDGAAPFHADFGLADASLSASALESALLSNLRGTGSRL